MLGITEQFRDNWVLLQINGEIDMATGPQLRQRIVLVIEVDFQVSHQTAILRKHMEECQVAPFPVFVPSQRKELQEHRLMLLPKGLLELLYP